jgi:hypothetical protein
MFFMQQLGGAVFLAVGQNLFSSQLVQQLSGIAGLDPEAIVNTGATELRRVVAPDEIDTVVGAYSYSLTRAFILSAALSACMLIGALMVEWRSIKKNTGGAAKHVDKDAETGIEDREVGIGYARSSALR